MKQLIAFAVLSAVTFVAGAQEAIWGDSKVKSPEIAASGEVTFRIWAPDAASMSVSGDFSPSDISMTRDSSGLWSVTTPPLPPEFYQYRFRSGAKTLSDNYNAYKLRDTNTNTDYFIVGGGPDSLYIANNVLHGNVAKVWYPSATAGSQRRMTVYTPAVYNTDPSRRFPVLYLLHGMGGDENAWCESGRAVQILDNLIARGLVEPMIVVMPNGNIAMNAAPGEGASGMAQPTINLEHTMDGLFEQSFPEILNYVDANYRTVADAPHRAIAGLSMGGYHSMHISKQYPDTFGYVGLFSAAIFPAAGIQSEIYADSQQKLKRQFEAGPELYYIAIGTDDFLYDDNCTFRAALDEAGYKYVYNESAGGHTWRNWRHYLADFLPRLFK